MRRIVHITAILGIVLSALTSCRAISSFLSSDEAVAEVGTAKLYRGELNELIPKGLASEDSIRLARQYINTWALDQVFQNVAEEQLSKSEKDVTKELEEYRRSLLKYRYEQLYVNERLDTAVSVEQIEEYYVTHQEMFVLKRPVVKARFLKMTQDSPAFPKIKGRMSSDEVQDLVEADSIAYSSALAFKTWNDSWIDLAVLAREFGTDYVSLMSMKKGNWAESTDSTGVISVAYFSDMIMSGRVAPLEYSAATIKDMIVSARKQTLISDLERDLLDDARDNGQFIILE